MNPSPISLMVSVDAYHHVYTLWLFLIVLLSRGVVQSYSVVHSVVDFLLFLPHNRGRTQKLRTLNGSEVSMSSLLKWTCSAPARLTVCLPVFITLNVVSCFIYCIIKTAVKNQLSESKGNTFSDVDLLAQNCCSHGSKQVNG